MDERKQVRYDDRGYEILSDEEYLMFIEAIRIAAAERAEFNKDGV